MTDKGSDDCSRRGSNSSNDNNNGTGNNNNTSSNSNTDQPVLLVIGASFGGFGCIKRLLESSGDGGSTATATDHYKIILVDAKDWFSIGGTWQFVWTGRLELEASKVPLRNANVPLVDMRLCTRVTEWRSETKQVVLVKENHQDSHDDVDDDDDDHAHSTVLSYDTIVVACGAIPDPSTIPGMEQHVNICGYDSVPRQKQQVAALLQKAAAAAAAAENQDTKPDDNLTFVMAIGACPYKCPPAPFELTFLLEEMLCQHGVRDKVRLVITCPVKWPMPPAFEEIFQKEMKARHVEFLPNHVLDKIDNDDSSSDGTTMIHYKNGTTLPATVLWTTFPLKAPDFVQKAIPTSIHKGFVQVDKATHAVAGIESAHVVGDCCTVPIDEFLIIPKAGEFAWKMGRSAADAILQKMKNDNDDDDDDTSDDKADIDRRAACTAEIGHGRGIALVSDLSKFCQDNGSPNFEIHQSETGEQQKIEWVNSYYKQIFGAKAPVVLLDGSSGHRKRARDE